MRASSLFLPHFPEKRLGRKREEDTRISILLFGRNREVVNGRNRQEGINAKWEGIKGKPSKWQHRAALPPSSNMSCTH